MDLILNSSKAWTEYLTNGVAGEIFRILKETANWLDASSKIDGLMKKD